MSVELRRRKEAFIKACTMFEATKANYQGVSSSVSMHKFVKQAKEKFEEATKYLIKTRNILVNFCERSMLGIPEEVHEMNLKYLDLITEFERKELGLSLGTAKSIRARCCFKKRKPSQLQHINGYDSSGYYCIEGFGCKKKKK